LGQRLFTSALTCVQVTETEHLSQLSVFTKQQLDDGQRQYNRERGQIDYLGIDSFDNIQKQLDHKLSSSSHQHPDPPKIQISSEKGRKNFWVDESKKIFFKGED